MDRGDLTGAVVGQYRLDALIGRGGMGEVYRAYDHTLGRAVALKVLPPALVGNEDNLTRFVQEARSASALNHPHVISIYQIGREIPVTAGGSDGAAAAPVNFIAMELVAGETLRALLDRQRPELKRSLEYLTQAADALAAAHAAGIVHRDFKPDNVMVAEGDYVKVLDFGLAKPSAQSLLEHADTQRTALGTSPGVILGTVGYMSPEQGEGRKADHRSDIFSFGCVLYEITTGARAFRGTSPVDTLHRIIHDEPDPVATHAPAAPMELQRIIRRCLAKDPEARYQSMKDVAIDLRALRRDLDSTASFSLPPRQEHTTRGHTRTWVGLALITVIAIAAVSGWRAWTARTTAAEPVVPLRIERLTGSGGVTDAVISPDGKYVAYVEAQSGDQSLWVRQLAGTQPLQLVPPARVGFWGLQFSPDASSVFYTVRSPTHASGHLYQISLLGGTPRLVLTGIDSAITWSPGGEEFAYLRENHPQPGESAVMIAGVGGGTPRQLAVKRPPAFFAPGFFVTPAWSPDGRLIASSVRNTATRDAGLVTIEVATGAESAFRYRYRTPGFASWLPDGSGIVFLAPPPDGVASPGGGQIYIQPYPEGPPRRVTTDLVEYRNATLSRDGRSLVTVGADFSPTLWQVPLDTTAAPRRIPSIRYDGTAGLAGLPDGRLLFTTLVGHRTQIAIMNVDGSNRHVLTSEGVSVSPRATHDGRTIVFVSRRDGDQHGIWRMDATGSNARLLAQVPDASYLTITPDDRTVLFTSAATGPSATWRVSIEGGAPELVTARIDRAALSPDGKLLAGLSRSEGTLVLAVVRTEDGQPVRSFSGQAFTAQGGVVEWTADGTGVIFTTAERSNLWLQPLSGGDPVKLTAFTDQTLFRVAQMKDGSLIASRGNQVRDAFLLTNFR